MIPSRILALVRQLSFPIMSSQDHNLAIDYLDLYLIHSAYGGTVARLEAWKALLAARNAGKLRSVGVSN